MKTLNEILRDSDPASFEIRSAGARAATRSAVLAGSQPHDHGRKTMTRWRVLAFAGVAAAVVAVAVFGWNAMSIDAVAAVRFEARIAGTTNAIVRNSDIARAEVVAGPNDSTFEIAVTFKDGAAKKMRTITAQNTGKQLELLIDGKVVMAPTIRSAFPDSSGRSLITGNYTRADADRIVAGIIGR